MKVRCNGEQEQDLVRYSCEGNVCRCIILFFVGCDFSQLRCISPKIVMRYHTSLQLLIFPMQRAVL